MTEFLVGVGVGLLLPAFVRLVAQFVQTLRRDPNDKLGRVSLTTERRQMINRENRR